jgi:hypothetical protein
MRISQKLSFLTAQSAGLKILTRRMAERTGAVMKARASILSQSGLSAPHCALRSIPSCWPDIWYVPVRLSFHRLLTTVKAVTKDQRENLPAGRFDWCSRDGTGCLKLRVGLPTSCVRMLDFRESMPRIQRSACSERIRTRPNHQDGKDQCEVYLGSNRASDTMRNMIARRRRRTRSMLVIVLLAAANVGNIHDSTT